MQIRLTVLAPRSGQSRGVSPGAPAPGAAGAAAPGTRADATACDVLVTAPAGTALAAVASGLAAAVQGAGPETTGAVVVYAGRERLDAQRCALGEPPLVDGAVLSLQFPADEDAPELSDLAQLQVVAGPDAGGVHLLHGGQIRVGRSLDADVPLDDPDVSRLHCAVTLGDDGRVTVADLGSTNGTTLDGRDVGPREVRLAPGALLRIGESALRLAQPGAHESALSTAPDGEGHLRVARTPAAAAVPAPGRFGGSAPHHRVSGRGAGTGTAARTGYGTVPAQGSPPGSPGPGSPGGTGGGAAVPGGGNLPAGGSWSASAYGGSGAGPAYDGSEAGPAYDGSGAGPAGYAPEARHPAAPPAAGGQDPYPGPADRTHGAGRIVAPGGPGGPGGLDGPGGPAGPGGSEAGAGGGSATGAPANGRPAEPREEPRRRGGIGGWARRLTSGRGEAAHDHAGESAEPAPRHDAAAPSRPAPPDAWQATPPGAAHRVDSADAPVPSGSAPDAWPDAATLLLTALQPGPRLWERGLSHPESLVLRLGTADRTAPDGTGLLPAVPVTVGLREAGSLGLAGPRARLAGLARSAVAQLAALHSPTELEIVLISADRTRGVEERTQEWGWLGWLPHLRPAHGQDCRLLLAYDRDQASARVAELVRRTEEGPLEADAPRTVVILDGDPGSAGLREATARLAAHGSAHGIHLLCLAETPAASPLSPVEVTYDAACAVSSAFRECGAAALLSGEVATAVRVLRTAGGQSAGHGTLASVDAVSAAWAERFARALAPLRDDAADLGGGPGPGGASAGRQGRRPAASLPPVSRLLDELGLARATPASLMARWAAAADDEQAPGATRAWAVLGAGPRGPLCADLAIDGPHLLIEGPAGSGRTEMLRSAAASLSAAARPDRLGLILLDGAGGERGEGLRACTELPHVSTHLVASDPVRMREFAQALGAELKRRDELLGTLDFADWHAGRGADTAGTGTGAAAGTTGATGARGVSTTAGVTGARGVSTTAGVTGVRGAGAANGTAGAADEVAERLVSQRRAPAPESRRADIPGSRSAQATGMQGPGAQGPGAHRPGGQGPGAHGPAGGAGPDRPHGHTPATGYTSPRAETRTESRTESRTETRTQSRTDPRADIEGPGTGTLRLRPAAARERERQAAAQAGGGPSPLPRLVVLVDDLDALVAPALGSPGRPSAGSVVRALEAVARHGERLGVHLVASTARPDRTAGTELAQGARLLRVVLDPPSAAPAPEEPAPGRGRLLHPDGTVTPFQGGRVTGRIPRTATQRPTVVPLEWERMGDPPTRRPVRELGNGPTDLALLASALDRAARTVNAAPPVPLNTPQEAR
ncbi:FHA domain-containing protein [Streptomyces sp. NPDC058657]|uniref:FHA domain-containing protein n=1 Tax=unclassified Streptomyces TaxID=2593676 RepID=UPI003659F567